MRAPVNGNAAKAFSGAAVGIVDPPPLGAPVGTKIGATSIGEIEKLIGGMQEAKNFLQSEKERIQRETARYAKLAQTASASIEIIFDTVRGWREAGHPVDNQ